MASGLVGMWGGVRVGLKVRLDLKEYSCRRSGSARVV